MTGREVNWMELGRGEGTCCSERWSAGETDVLDTVVESGGGNTLQSDSGGLRG